MSNPNDEICRDFEARLSDLLDLEEETSTPAEIRASLRRHAEACALCSVRLRRYRRTVGLVRALPRKAPPPGFLERILEEQMPREDRWLAWRPSRGLLAVAAAALFVAAVGGVVLRSLRRPAGDGDLVEVASVPETLRAVDEEAMAGAAPAARDAMAGAAPAEGEAMAGAAPASASPAPLRVPPSPRRAAKATPIPSPGVGPDPPAASPAVGLLEPIGAAEPRFLQDAAPLEDRAGKAGLAELGEPSPSPGGAPARGDMLVSLVLPPGAGRLGDWEALTKELQGKYAPAAQKSAEAGAPSSAPPTSAPGAAVPVGAPMDRTLQRGAAKGGSPARNLDLDGTPAPAGAEPAREGASEAFQVRSRSSAPRPAPRLEAREAAPRSDPGLAFRAVEGTSEIVIDLEPEALDSLRAYLRSWVAARDGDLQVSEVFAEDVAKAKESVEKGAADGSPLRDALAVGGGAEPAAEEGVPAPAAEMEPEAAGAESGAGVEGEEIEVAAPPDREAADILVPAAGAAGFAPAETKSEAPRRLRVRVRLGSMPPVQR